MNEPTRLVCHAPHRRHRGEQCGAFLDVVVGTHEFVTTASKHPGYLDGLAWRRCTCGSWNAFRAADAGPKLAA